MGVRHSMPGPGITPREQAYGHEIPGGLGSVAIATHQQENRARLDSALQHPGDSDFDGIQDISAEHRALFWGPCQPLGG